MTTAKIFLRVNFLPWVLKPRSNWAWTGVDIQSFYIRYPVGYQMQFPAWSYWRLSGYLRPDNRFTTSLMFSPTLVKTTLV